MKRVPWPAVALVAVLGAAFCVQATSTWKFGQRQHLAEIALPALVVLLEVGSITTAAIFFSARSRGLRVRALLLLAVTAGLGGAGGVIAYGFAIGVPVAILMLGLVEVIGAFRRERSAVVEESTADDHPVEPPVEADPDGPPSPRDDRDVVAPPSETRPLVESPVEAPAETMHVVGYTGPAWEPTEHPLDSPMRHPVVEPEPVDPATELLVAHEPTEADYAAQLLDAQPRDGRPLSERELLAALRPVSPTVTRYRAKTYLGNPTRRMEAVS